MARGGGQGQAVHEYLVEQPRDLGQVQADEIRVKKQGGMVWMALAMMVQTRLWLGGEVSEQRDLALIRRLVERVKRCAARRPLLVCTDGLVSSILYRSTVFWTPSGLKLGCISQGTPLLLSHLGRGFVAMPTNQPGLIVLALKRLQRQAEFFHGIKSFEP